MEVEDGYLEFVQEQAKKLNKIFMLDTSEGHDFEYEEKGWYVEELSGWLISPEDGLTFLEAREDGTLEDKFIDDFVWVNWEFNNNQLSVEFEKIENYYEP